MCRFLIIAFALLHAGNLAAQRITLHHLMGFHSLDDSAISAQLREDGWRYHGIQQTLPRKPRMYASRGNTCTEARIFIYQYQKKPLSKVELVCSDVAAFNTTIRDSMGAYGFVPDVERHAPDEENLKISSAANFVNMDAALPVHALILYYEERRRPRVSLTIYADE